jgi:hypothetical protein
MGVKRTVFREFRVWDGQKVRFLGIDSMRPFFQKGQLEGLEPQ